MHHRRMLVFLSFHGFCKRLFWVEDAIIMMNYVLIQHLALKGTWNKIPIDKFGTGSSCLARLKHNSIDKLKIGSRNRTNDYRQD